MPIEKHPLGWDEPALGRAVDWLLARHATPRAIDLSGLILVLPARRAGRRLIELLASACDGRVLSPPRIVTPSALPEHLYPGPVPEPDADFDVVESPDLPDPSGVDAAPRANDVASPLAALLARTHALRNAPPEEIETIFPRPPAKTDFSSWVAIAGDLARLDDDLSSHCLTVAQVPTQLAEAGRPLDDLQTSRWQALASLQARFERTLLLHGLLSLSAARRRALEHKACRCEKSIVLLAATDLSPLQHAMLHAVAEAGTRIDVLLHAPADEADAFDELGRFRPEKWVDRHVDLGDAKLKIVDRPRDQAHAVVHALAAATREEPMLSPDDATVGLGDEMMAPLFERALEMAGTPARHAAGRLVSRSRAVLLLQAWAVFVQSGRPADLAALLRHSDAEALLSRRFSAAFPGDAPPSWPGLLDRYISDHLHGSSAPNFVASPQGARLAWASRELIALGGENPDHERPLPEWSDVIAGAMTAFYEGAALSATDPAQSALVRSLRSIGEALRQIAGVRASLRFVPRVGLQQAVALVVNQLSKPLPPVTLGPAVELLGWLELPLDDARVLVLTGLNEGQVPESITADPFLPDSCRTALGIVDNRHRYARDLLALHTLLRSRRRLTLVAGRRSADGEPIAPSRLLLACPPAELIQRLGAFYSGAGEASAPPLISGRAAARSGLIVPPPAPLSEPIDKLNVTAFADYLRCPYRFYLKHVRKLARLDDSAVELDARAYGTLVHGVLKEFACSDLATSTNAQRVGDCFADLLAKAAGEVFGKKLPPAVTLQLMQLEHRLRILARWQAKETENGWRIQRELVEREFRGRLDLGDNASPFGVEGRIDRVDLHGEHGYRVIDFKTSDSKQAVTPEKRHREGPRDAKRWVDLQLPLYHELVGEAVGRGAGIQLAFVNLPASIDATIFAAADWDDAVIESAKAKAREVARGVREQRFWPPSEPPQFEDEYTAVCFDQSPARAAAIGASPTSGGLP